MADYDRDDLDAPEFMEDVFPDAPWNWIHQGSESDMTVEPLPKLPEGLLEKTLKHLEPTVRLEIARRADPGSEKVRRAVAEFMGKEYVPAPESKDNFFKRSYKKLSDWFWDRLLPY